MKSEAHIPKSKGVYIHKKTTKEMSYLHKWAEFVKNRKKLYFKKWIYKLCWF